MCTLAIMSRRKQLRPFKVQDDDDDDDDNNAKPAKKNADNGISTSSNGDNADATHNTSKLHVIFIMLKVFFHSFWMLIAPFYSAKFLFTS